MSPRPRTPMSPTTAPSPARRDRLRKAEAATHFAIRRNPGPESANHRRVGSIFHGGEADHGAGDFASEIRRTLSHLANRRGDLHGGRGGPFGGPHPAPRLGTLRAPGRHDGRAGEGSEPVRDPPGPRR